LLLFAVPVFAADEETAAVRSAVNAVLPFLVRINTVGGREKVGNEFANDGTGTGVLLDKDGYVITAAFLFLHDPSSIILQFNGGTKKVAKKVATDRNRMLTLLKVDGLNTDFLAGKLLTAVPKDAVRTGERCIAVGVALSPDEPNVAIGIISGENRIWGKALQTDAAVSPNNYGGTLISSEGKVFGIPVPLSMMSNELTAGAELYDAGVGTAIPLDDITAILPRLKEGKDLEPGITGIEFKDNRIFIGEAVIDRIQKDSPAEKAGLKTGGKIVSFDGKPVASAIEAVMLLRSSYAGDKIVVRVLQDGEEQEFSLTAEEKKNI
jgi:serine protease Do